MNKEDTFQNLMLRKLLQPSDTKLVLDPAVNISVMELVVNKLLSKLITCKGGGENHVGLFELVRDTAFGKPQEFRTVSYRSNEFSDILRAAQKIIDQGGE